MNWIGLVPAAGQGTRLGLPFPKELYPLIQKNYLKPVCQNVIEQLREAGVEDIVVVINETKYQIISYLKSGMSLSCNFIYVYQERRSIEFTNSTSPGLAHAIDSAYHVIKDKLVFFGMPDTVVFPNNVFSQGLSSINDSDVILCLFRTDTPYKFGMVKRDRNGRVIEVIDKPAYSQLDLMWGYIIWKPDFTNFIHDQVKHSISEFSIIINNAISQGIKFNSIVVKDGKYYDFGTVEDLIKIKKQF
ncbi:MAG: hypothetical protein KatS3mg083_639 [Candidatus Dojkabacteria bacterium]|nr:MAG: hypothetical protein KatS3mg045_1591 [Bellilinea sp.]GIW57694.1 MAG: hypothetical protein KatS3mg083_639 [Candidatus Dojkabacteria bacterium]